MQPFGGPTRSRLRILVKSPLNYARCPMLPAEPGTRRARTADQDADGPSQRWSIRTSARSMCPRAASNGPTGRRRVPGPNPPTWVHPLSTPASQRTRRSEAEPTLSFQGSPTEPTLNESRAHRSTDAFSSPQSIGRGRTPELRRHPFVPKEPHQYRLDADTIFRVHDGDQLLTKFLARPPSPSPGSTFASLIHGESVG